jgi:sugar phosphate isomerase/epimerase
MSGAEVVALETCFIDAPGTVLRYAACRDPLVMLSWGHPYGLEYGTSVKAEEDLLEWMNLAAELEARRMRIVVAHPALREDLWRPDTKRKTVDALRRVARRARERDLDLVIENHADLTAQELSELIDGAEVENVGVCLDIANAVRVGDDPVEAARMLAPSVRVMHVKDVDLTRPYGLTGPPSVQLGTGSLPVREVIDIVLGSGSDVWLLVEIAQIENSALVEEEWIERDIAWIRSQL